MQWSSSTYLKFEKERTQPSIDLTMRLQSVKAERIIDIGCGPGNSTAVFKKFFPKAHVLGIDNSQNMIEKASCDYHDIEFVCMDASSDLGKISDRFDIVFSNACIQWIPNHKKLLKDMFGLLTAGGVLAVQIPINYNGNKKARKFWVFRPKCRYSVGINRDVYTFITTFDCRKQPLFQ